MEKHHPKDQSNTELLPLDFCLPSSVALAVASRHFLSLFVAVSPQMRSIDSLDPPRGVKLMVRGAMKQPLSV